MQPYLKITAITLCAFIFAMIASSYVRLSSTDTLDAYEAKYRELSTKPNVTAAEQQELEQLFKELNSAKNVQADLIEFAVKYLSLFVVLIPLVLFAAKHLKLEEGPMFAASGLIFLAFIIAGLLVVGAIAASVFFIASVTYQKSRTTAAG